MRLEQTTSSQKSLAMIIDRKPPFLQAFFSPFRQQLSRPQFGHFWSLLVAWVANVRRSTLLDLTSRLPRGAHRTSHGRFLTQSDWDGANLLDNAVVRELNRMRPRRGEFVELIIDDHRIAKRGRKMFGVSKIWDHKDQRFVRGHIVVAAAVRFRNVIFPWRFELWLPKSCGVRRYRKTTQIAAEMIRAFQPPAGLRVRVLFDAFYLSPTVTKACENRGFTWFSVASRNRTITRTRGVSQKIGDLAPGRIRYAGRRVHMPRSRGKRTMRIAAVDGRLSRIGPVRLVFSKRPHDPWKKVVAFATNEVKLGARTIVSIYERRWRIEVLFKELERELGLSDYQVLTHLGIVHHLHLCGLAHLMLTHHGMEAVGAQARKANTDVALPPLRTRFESFRAAVKCDQLRRMLSHEKNKTLCRKVKEFLMAA